MHSKSDSIEVMAYNDANEVIEKIDFEKKREKMILSLIALIFKCHKMNFKGDGSDIYFPDWRKKKKATIKS